MRPAALCRRASTWRPGGPAARVVGSVMRHLLAVAAPDVHFSCRPAGL